MHSTVQLHPVHWCYQMYLWDENLDPSNCPKQKVIKTLIYGVRSSGNQAEQALREVAKQSFDQYPESVAIIINDTYVDDCASGDKTKELAIQRSEELELVGNKGGFKLKGVVVSGEHPPESMSEDGCTVFVAGMRWFPKKDQLSLL